MPSPKVIFSNRNASPEAIQAAHILIELYNAQTIDTINQCEPDNPFLPLYRAIAEKLIGIGNTKTCILCTAVANCCSHCIYEHTLGCLHGHHAQTFDAILDAQTASELLEAFRLRALHISEVLRQIKFLQQNNS